MDVRSTSRVRNVANELPRVKSERFALRIKISCGLLQPCALERERERESRKRTCAKRGGYKGKKKEEKGGRGGAKSRERKS